MPRVEIWRDAAGVPLIKASSELDVAFGLGTVHATDRLLQMQSVRVLGEGRSAELFADIEVLRAYDVKLRSMQLAEDARRQTDLLDAGLKKILEAYADGVNSVTHGGGRKRRTLAMRILRMQPERWEPWHCLLVLKVMGFVALAEIQEDIERFIIEAVRRGVDTEKLKGLFPGQLDGIDPDLIRKVTDTTPIAEKAALPQALAASGSNAFAVAASRSKSGRAMLANDPHLQVNRLPAVWMEAMAEWPGRRIMGSTVPGGPAFVSARTNDLAWGITYTMADTVDFFVEEVKDDQVRRKGGFVPIEVRQERIGRRGAEPMTVRVRESDLGILEGSGDGFHLAMEWAGRKGAGAASFAAIQALTHTATVPEAMEIVRGVEVPHLNWILADTKGNIAWQVGGRYPKRVEGRSGLYPVAGFSEDAPWLGYYDPAELPSILNPESGVVVTANNNRDIEGGIRYVSVPHPDCRAQRIEAVLRANEKTAQDDLKSAHLDTTSLQADSLLQAILPLLPDSAEKEALTRWDRRYTPESREATLFENLWRELLLTVFGDGEGDGGGEASGRGDTGVGGGGGGGGGGGTGGGGGGGGERKKRRRSRGLTREWLRELLDETSLHVFLFGQFDDILCREDSPWLKASRREEVIRAAAARAFKEPWPPWRKVSRFTFSHIFLGGHLPAFLGFDRGPFPVSGSRATPRQGSLFRRNGREVLIAPSYRTVMELGEEMVAWTCLPGGSDERRLSRHYHSEIEAWLQGRYKTLSFDGVTRRETVLDLR